MMLKVHIRVRRKVRLRALTVTAQKKKDPTKRRITEKIFWLWTLSNRNRNMSASTFKREKMK